MSESGAIYLDSALIAKFYLHEPGRDIVRELARSSGQVVCSAIAVAEISSAFHRKWREKSLDEEVHAALQGQFAHDLKAGLWSLIPVTEIILEQVQSLFSRLEASAYLRSLDAIHLITAREEQFRKIYSNDRRLLDSCSAAALEGANPLA